MHAETRHRSIPAIPVRKLLCTSAGGTSNGNTLSGSRNNLSGKRLATMAPTSCRLNWCPSSATGWGTAVYRACARCIARPCRPSSLFWRRLAGAPIRIGWLPDVSRRARAAPRSPATVMCWISRGRCLVSWRRIASPGRPPPLPLASSNPGALREVVCPAATNATVSKAVITRRRGCAIQYGIVRSSDTGGWLRRSWIRSANCCRERLSQAGPSGTDPAIPTLSWAAKVTSGLCVCVRVRITFLPVARVVGYAPIAQISAGRASQLASIRSRYLHLPDTDHAGTHAVSCETGRGWQGDTPMAVGGAATSAAIRHGQP